MSEAGSSMSPRHLPILTLATLGPTVLLSATRLFTDGPLDALRRDPSALGHGQVWRLISPVLVQSDASVTSVVLVFAVCAAIGIYAERFFPPLRWLALYFVGAVSGHALGEAFQPYGGGTSVAFVGILGGLAAYSLLDLDPRLSRWWRQAALMIPLAVLDTVLGDIHGVPYLLGLATGAVWVLSEVPAGDRVGALRASFADRSTPSIQPDPERRNPR
jgi:Rhomboid family